MNVSVVVTSGINVGINSLGIQGPIGPSGQTEIPTGIFYPLTGNPSGFLTGENLFFASSGLFALKSNTGNFITTSQTGNFAANTGQLTGTFYLLSNPSGFITGENLFNRFIL